MSDGIILGIKSNGGGCYVGDERKFTAQDKKNLEANTKARHTHDNKALLDDLQKVLDGKVSAEDGKGLSTVGDINIFGAASVDAGIPSTGKKDNWTQLVITKPYSAEEEAEAKETVDLYTRDQMQEKLAAKANKRKLVGVDIKTVTDSGIYSIGSDCTGLPEDLPKYYCGATLIVDNMPTDTEYTSANQYLIVNDYVDENGYYTYKSRIYACMLYGGSYDMPWTLVCDGAWGDELAEKAGTSYVDEALKLKADLAWIKSLLPQSTASGTSITLTDHLEGMEVINYSIYGNSTQDGEPTPETPIEIQSVGDLITDEEDENYGKYDVPVTVNDETYHIYINEPLRKVGDYADYIDYQNQQVVRKVGMYAFDGSEAITTPTSNQPTDTAYVRYYTTSPADMLSQTTMRGVGRSNRFATLLLATDGAATDVAREGLIFGLSNKYINHIISTDRCVGADAYKALLSEWYNAGEPLTTAYPLATPITESITIPQFTVKESDTVTVNCDTDIQPGNMEVTYYQDNSKRIAALEAAITALGGV